MKDILIVIKHFSQKCSGVVKLSVPEEVNGLTKFEFPGSVLKTRTYVQKSDREMDIWKNINTACNDDGKSLTLHWWSPSS